MTSIKAAAALTGPVEDYLKVIFDLESRFGVAETNSIAEELRIAPASVSGMIRRLVEQGLISHERYRGVRLTSGGRRAALRTIRRHRVIEAYLTTALDYPWDLVHDEAERLEHAASDELVDRMAAAIGEPATDPHGAPIPTREGRLDAAHAALVTLASVAPGSRACVQRVSDRDPEELRYLAELGITPGREIDVVEHAPFDGPISLRVGRTVRVIGAGLASRVLVSVVKGR